MASPGVQRLDQGSRERQGEAEKGMSGTARGDCPLTRTPAVPRSPGPFPTPLASLQAAPSWKPSGLPYGPSPRTQIIGAFSTLHSCFPPPRCQPHGARSEEGHVRALDPVRVLPPSPGSELLPCLPCPNPANSGPAEGTQLHPPQPRPVPQPQGLAHLRGGAPRLLIWLWAWVMSCPAFCRYIDGK